MSEPTAKSNLPIQRMRDRGPRSPSSVPLGKGYTDPQGRAWGTLRALADAHGVHPYTLGMRLRQGWGLTRALTPPGVVHPVTGERVTRRALAAEVGISPQAIGYREAMGVDLLIPKMDRRAAGAVRRK